MTSREQQPTQPDPVAVLGSAVVEALNRLELPVYVVDLAGKLRWANEATTELIGKCCGQSYLSFVAADSRDRAKDHFARKVVGGFPTAYEIAVVDQTGRRVPLKVHGAPLRSGGSIIGVFGLAVPASDGLALPTRDDRPLTPRQVEILRLLAEGAGTTAISTELGVAVDTVRNHLRGLFRRLDAHTRLEAVAAARRRGLLKEREGE